jgi:hypothetical protein
MAITRKHYQEIAKVFQRTGATLRLYKGHDRISYKSAQIIWADCISQMALVFAADNRNFDKDTFYKACVKLTEDEKFNNELDRLFPPEIR